MRGLWVTFIAVLVGGTLSSTLSFHAVASDYVVYGVYKNLELGNPDEVPQKDFYINMGSNQGLKLGSNLDVMRRIPTYDGVDQKYYQDVNLLFAKLKVIHVERNVAVARLDKMLPQDKTPAVSPRAVMVGDIVRPGSSQAD